MISSDVLLPIIIHYKSLSHDDALDEGGKKGEETLIVGWQMLSSSDRNGNSGFVNETVITNQLSFIEINA